MSSQTKIIVLKQKNLLYGALIVTAVLVLLLVFLFALPKESNSSAPNDDFAQYTAGVYSSTVVLNGNPVEIKVTIDENLIHHINASNISDSVETMFPLFHSSLDEIAGQVIANNSTQNVTYSSENKYTSIVLLEAIELAIEKSRK